MKTGKESPEAIAWWGQFSINEQNEMIKNHPFFGKMSKVYFNSHSSSITQIYEHEKTCKKVRV